MKKRVSEQPYSGNSAKKKCVNRFQPILFGGSFHEVLQHLVPSLYQLAALAYVVMLAGIDLAHRRVFYIRWYAEKLTEEVQHLTNMAVNEPY
jgi:hypothetical protein